MGSGGNSLSGGTGHRDRLGASAPEKRLASRSGNAPPCMSLGITTVQYQSGMFLGTLKQRVLILIRAPSIEPGGEAPDIPKEDLPDTTNAKTVEALLDNLRRLVAYEEQRLNSLTTRGSALAGFAGVGTAVIAAGSEGSLDLAVKVLLAVSAAGLVFVAGGVVLGMLATRSTTIQSTMQVSLYRQPGYREVSPARVQIQMIDILIGRLKGLRAQNQTRAAWLNRSALGLIASVALAATAALVRLFA